jgi:hypothetical protein
MRILAGLASEGIIFRQSDAGPGLASLGASREECRSCPGDEGQQHENRDFSANIPHNDSILEKAEHCTREFSFVVQP